MYLIFEQNIPTTLTVPKNTVVETIVPKEDLLQAWKLSLCRVYGRFPNAIVIFFRNVYETELHCRVPPWKTHYTVIFRCRPYTNGTNDALQNQQGWTYRNSGRIENGRPSSPRKWCVMSVNVRVSIGLDWNLVMGFARGILKTKRKNNKNPHLIVRTMS